MVLKNQNILFLTRTMALGGTENVILQLCEILKPQVNKIIVCSAGGVNEEKLSDMGIDHVKIEDMENKNPFVIMKNLRIIKGIIKKEKITIIHSHHRMAAMYANLVFNSKIIKLANAHNTFKDKIFFTKLAYNKTNIIAVGEMVKKNLMDVFNIDKNRIVVIHNAIKPFNKKIVIEDSLKKYKDEGYSIIGNIGRLSEQKGMEYFIDAASLLKKEIMKLKFIVVGSGEDEEKLKNKVKELDLEKDFNFLGYRKDIQNLMSQMDLIVLSSLWEGLPLTPIEAFSVGKTIVATAVDGTPEIVIDRKSGLLVEPRNSKQIAIAIKELIEDKKQRSILEKNAKKTFTEEFSFSKLSKEYLDYYRKIVGEKNEK